MTRIANTVRSKPYPDVNGNEICLGRNGRIGHLQVYTWARGAEAGHDDTPLQCELVARLSALLKIDPECQAILAKLDTLYAKGNRP